MESGFKTLTYRPWIPRDGMAGTFQHLVRSWGDPNTAHHKWEANVLQRVCERGAAVPLVFDRNASDPIYERIMRKND